MDKYYAKLGKNGEITIMYYGLQEDEMLVEVDFSSQLYKVFYESMPISIGVSLPDPK